MKDGKDSVDEIIDVMDSYFLTKEDYDAMMELGLGDMAEEKVKIDTATKSAFTRLYNSRSHPLPFMRASNVKVAKGGAAKEKPDLEEAIEEEEDDIAVEQDEDDDDDEIDLKKDKYIKAPKKKPAGKAAAKKGKGKKTAAAVDEDEDEEEEVKKPAKGKGGRKAKAKA